MWKSDDAWNFETKTKARNLIYIEDISKAKFLGITNDSKVLLENFKEHGQVWKKGKPNAEGYFTLENLKVSKVMTATSSTSIELKGNITKHTT